MTTPMTTRSTAALKCETENESQADSTVRLNALEEQVRQMSLTLNSIPAMLLEFKNLVMHKAQDVPVAINNEVYTINDCNIGDLDDDIDFKKSHQAHMVSKLKILDHFYSLFPTITLASNFRRYDIMLKFFIDIQRKFAYHDVPSMYQVKILLRVMEGSDEITEFLRRTDKFKSEHLITSADLEQWSYEDFKKEFISLFLDQGSIYVINDVLNSWHSTTFNSARKAIDDYNLTMKLLREISLVFGGETSIKNLSNSHNKYFIRTITQAMHDQVIMHMEINDLGVSRVRNVRSVKTIHELEYNELSEILMVVESKKEISKSLFPSKGNTKRTEGYVNKDIKTDEKVIRPCFNNMKGTCTYGAACYNSHDPTVIEEYKKTDEYKNKQKQS